MSLNNFIFIINLFLLKSLAIPNSATIFIALACYLFSGTIFELYFSVVWYNGIPHYMGLLNIKVFTYQEFWRKKIS